MNTTTDRKSAESHYTEGRRWSHISNAWILLESWNDKEEIASIRASFEETNRKRLAAAQSTILALTEALELAQKNAKRYFFLRDRAYIGVHPHHKDLPLEDRTGWTTRMFHGGDLELDAAIDAALAAQKQGGV